MGMIGSYIGGRIDVGAGILVKTIFAVRVL